MKLPLVVATTAAALVGSALVFAQEPKAAAPGAAPAAAGSDFKDLRSKASYALGQNMGKMFKIQGVDIDPDLVAKGLKDGIAGSGAHCPAVCRKRLHHRLADEA